MNYVQVNPQKLFDLRYTEKETEEKRCFNENFHAKIVDGEISVFDKVRRGLV